MQAKDTNRKPNSYLVGITLVLCICFLCFFDTLLPGFQPSCEISKAEAEGQFVPTSTPVPTPPPKPLMEPVNLPSDPYPDLYGDNPTLSFLPPEEKTVYLTFDDGPSASTGELLKILKAEDARATFFVMGDTPEKRVLLQQIIHDGHSVGVHTYTHDYRYIYWTKDSFLADFCRQYYAIWDATGYRPRIFRFPGGSVNSYNRHLYRDLISEMEGRGFVYYDWNVTSEDAVGVTDPEKQLEELLSQSQNKSRIVALLHDSAQNPDIWWTVQEYIRSMKEQGYTFRALDSSVMPVHFPY